LNVLATKNYGILSPSLKMDAASSSKASRPYLSNYVVAQLAEALRYKPKGCGFDSR
jgi:hypothetical protein